MAIIIMMKASGFLLSAVWPYHSPELFERAYDSMIGYADFQEGAAECCHLKPDLVAPGVNIVAPCTPVVVTEQ